MALSLSPEACIYFINRDTQRLLYWQKTIKGTSEIFNTLFGFYFKILSLLLVPEKLKVLLFTLLPSRVSYWHTMVRLWSWSIDETHAQISIHGYSGNCSSLVISCLWLLIVAKTSENGTSMLIVLVTQCCNYNFPRWVKLELKRGISGSCGQPGSLSGQKGEHRKRLGVCFQRYWTQILKDKLLFLCQQY